MHKALLLILIVPFVLLINACGSKCKGNSTFVGACGDTGSQESRTAELTKATDTYFRKFLTRIEGTQEFLLSNSVAPAHAREMGANAYHVEVLLSADQTFEYRYWETAPGRNQEKLNTLALNGTWKVEVTGEEGRVELQNIGSLKTALVDGRQAAALTLSKDVGGKALNAKSTPMAYLGRTRDCCVGRGH